MNGTFKQTLNKKRQYKMKQEHFRLKTSNDDVNQLGNISVIKRILFKVASRLR